MTQRRMDLKKVETARHPAIRSGITEEGALVVLGFESQRQVLAPAVFLVHLSLQIQQGRIALHCPFPIQLAEPDAQHVGGQLHLATHAWLGEPQAMGGALASAQPEQGVQTGRASTLTTTAKAVQQQIS